MPTPYTEDCISFTGVFREPIGYPIFTDLEQLKPHARAMGMDDKELQRALFNQGNYVYLQADVYALLQGRNYAFIPPDDFIQALVDLYKKVEPRLPEDRARVKTKTGALEYRFMYENDLEKPPIFLRHPVTGTVTKHEHPYPAFQRIRFRSADPAFLARKAAIKDSLCGPLHIRPNFRSQPLEKLFWIVGPQIDRAKSALEFKSSFKYEPPVYTPRQIKNPQLPSVGTPVFQMSPGRREREKEARHQAYMHAFARRMGLCDSCSSDDSTSPLYRRAGTMRQPILRGSVTPPRRNPSRVAKTKSMDANAALFTRRGRRVV